MVREDERNNFPTELNGREAVREAEIVCLSKGIGERLFLVFIDHFELIGKYDP